MLATAATTLARAAPITVPATPTREPRAAAVIAARAPPTTWVIERAGFGFSGGVSPGGLLEGSRWSVLMSPSVSSGRGGPRGVAGVLVREPPTDRSRGSLPAVTKSTAPSARSAPQERISRWSASLSSSPGQAEDQSRARA